MLSFFATLRPELTDEQYIERIRRRLMKMDRWRRRFQVFYGLILFVLLGSVVGIVVLLQMLAQLIGNNIVVAGFIVGALIGIKFSLLLVHVTIALGRSLRSSRTESLMLRYHDAISEMADQSALFLEPPEAEAASLP